MSEGVNYIPDLPESFEHETVKKRSNAIWIILGILVVILLCCCLAGVLGLVGYFSYEEFDQWIYQITPYLHLI